MRLLSEGVCVGDLHILVRVIAPSMMGMAAKMLRMMKTSWMGLLLKT